MHECWPTEASPASVRLDDDPVIGTGCPKMYTRFCLMPVSCVWIPCRTPLFQPHTNEKHKKIFPSW